DGLMTHSLIPTFRYSRRKLRVRVGAGPQLATSGQGRNQLYLASLAEMTYTDRETTYGVTYTSGIGTGGGLAAATSNQTLFGTYSRIFNRKLDTEFRIGYSRAKTSFGAGPNILPQLQGTTNNGLIFESRIAYPLGKKLAIFFDYSHSRQSTEGNAGN